MGDRLIAGVPPFEGPNEAGLIEAVLLQPPRPMRDRRPDTPREVEDVVMRCLSKKPVERYPTARALRLALEATQIPSEHTLPLPRMADPPPKTVPIAPPGPPLEPPRMRIEAPVAEKERRGLPVAVLGVIVVGAAIVVGGAGYFIVFVLYDR